MHSEYDFEMYEDSYNVMFCDFHNSNYTGFEGKLSIPHYLEFIKHYYSNDGYFGIVSNLYAINMPDVEIKNEKHPRRIFRRG